MSATTEPAAGGPTDATRSVRDRVVDLTLILLATTVAVVTAVRVVGDPMPPSAWHLSADWAAGALSCLALWWRRRHPVPLGLILALASAFSETVAPASVVALFTVALHSSTRTTLAVCAVSLASLGVYQSQWPEPDAPRLTTAIIIGLGHLATIAWGLSLRNRRALVTALRERADAAEAEARLRAERSDREARDSLAREMHDVLGHRLSLLTVHAGALSYHRDASAADRERAAEVVRDNAHRAMQDLRDVIGLLRSPTDPGVGPGTGDVDPADLAELIAEARAAGTPIEVRDEAGVTTGPSPLPGTQARTVHRLVQEGLTNVRKHAPGARVVVRFTGRAGEHITAEVENDAPTGTSHGRGAGGQGLRGLSERARLLTGQLEHGPTPSGGWLIRLRIPWPA